MSKLSIYLPPYAPDYSGAASALFELGGLVVIHDASGCTGNYTGFDEPRWANGSSMVFCSALRHMDAILGNDDKFIGKIIKAAESLNPKFIAILGSPVPMIIGTDFKGIAKEIEQLTGIPTIGIQTTGLKYYSRGIYDITIELLKKFVPKSTNKEEGSVNLLGITPLDFYTNNHKDFIEFFEKQNIKVNCTYYMGTDLDKMVLSSHSTLNIAVSQCGVEVAKYMEKVYDIPYIVSTPLGTGNVILNYVTSFLKDGKIETYIPIIDNANTLIIGEQIIGNSIREYMQKELKYSGIKVATLYDISEEFFFDGDIKIKNERHLIDIVNSGEYTKVIGDPMIQKLIKKKEINFYELPHVALSSKLYWKESKQFISVEMEEWLKKIAIE